MEILNKLKLVYTSCYLVAYINEKGETKKQLSLSSNWDKVEKSDYNSKIKLYSKIEQKECYPNSYYILTEKSNILTIDIDDPEKHKDMVNRLLKDCETIVKTRKGYHFYFKNDESIPRRKIMHEVGVDINTKSLLFCPEYKNIHNDEVYKYEFIKSNKLVDLPDYAKIWINGLLSTFDSVKKLLPVKQKSVSKELVIDPNRQVEIYNIDIVDKICQLLYNNNHFKDYKLWTRTAFILRHINNTQEAFQLFHKYSKKVKEYSTRSELDNKKVFYGKYDDSFDETAVLLYCQKLDKNFYSKHLEHLYKSKYTDKFNYFDQQYLWEHDMFSEWHKNYKSLLIRSNYGTGKTFAFKKLIEKYKYKRILFLTYRQSLATSLTNELKEKYKFESYLDKQTDIKNANRLILQLDSISKISKTDSCFDEIETNKYDLVVIDEIEGILNHLSWEKINQPLVYGNLRKVIESSKKILALDGDLSDRTIDFINDIDDSFKIYVNRYQGRKKKFIFYKNITKFDKLINDDLINKKNIVIVSMTKTDTEKYYNYYKDKYITIIHNGLQKNKDILENVNENWQKAQLLIYSPSVEAGVDFTIEKHFDKVYCILTNQSTTYRAFSQMLNRVRNYISNEVYCYCGHLTYNPNDILTSIDELTNTKYKGIKMTPLLKILIHNDVERINNKNYFMKALIKYVIVDKGHDYVFINHKFVKQKGNSDQIKKNIIEAEDIDRQDFDDLLERQKKNEELTKSENLSIEKYLIKKKWLVDEITSDFINEHYKKDHVLTNYKLMTLNDEERILIQDNDYLELIKNRKIDSIKKLMLSIPKTREEFIKYVEETINNKTFKHLFDMKRGLKTQNHLQLLNSFLNNYGYNVVKQTKNVRDENSKVIKQYTYSLHTLNIIDEYNKRYEQKKLDKLKQEEAINYALDDDDDD